MTIDGALVTFDGEPTAADVEAFRELMRAAVAQHERDVAARTLPDGTVLEPIAAPYRPLRRGAER